MGQVERGAIKAPNNVMPGNHAANGYLPLGGQAGAVHGSNARFMDGDKGMSMPAGKSASPVARNGDRFDVSNAQMPQPPSAIQPGHGQIPVNPFQAVSGAPSEVEGILRDSAKVGGGTPK